MAAIAFSTAHQTEHIRERLQSALTRVREMIDAFVSHRMRLMAAEAERVGFRQTQSASSPSAGVR